MISLPYRRTIGIATSVMLVLVATAMAQSENPAWTAALETELISDHDCEVLEYLNLHEGKIGERNMYIAKVRCTDGRYFDATKLEPTEKFEIRACEVVAC